MSRRNNAQPSSRAQATDEPTPDLNDEPQDGPGAANEQQPEVDVEVLTVIYDERPEAPNLSLNLHYNNSRKGLHFAAFAGFLIQAGILVFFGIMVYHPSAKGAFLKEGKAVSAHAFPLVFSGTVLLVLGVLLCAHVVESSTQEEYYTTNNNAEIGIYWLQQEQKVNDQVFESFAVFPSQKSKTVIMSRRLPDDDRLQLKSSISTMKDLINSGHRLQLKTSISKMEDLINSCLEPVWKLLHRGKPVPRFSLQGATKYDGDIQLLTIETVVGALVALIGFIVQFIGLRAMNSYASLAQLCAIGVMTIWRAWLRRGFARSFEVRKLLPGFELEWLAWTLVDDLYPRNDDRTGKTRNASGPIPATEGLKHVTPGLWVPITGYNLPDKSPEGVEDCQRPNFKAHQVMESRRELGRLAKYHGDTTTQAIDLALAMEGALGKLSKCGEKCGGILDSGNDEWEIKNKPKTREKRLDLSGTAQDFWWSLRIAPHSSLSDSPLRASISISWKKSKWRVRADDLDAALSLWMYSVKAKDEDKRIATQCQKEPSNGGDDDSWIRSEVTDRTIRFIGPDEDTEQRALHQDMAWWMPKSRPQLFGVKHSSNPGHSKVQNNRMVGFMSSLPSSFGTGGSGIDEQYFELSPFEFAPFELYEKEDSIRFRDMRKKADAERIAYQSNDGLLKLYAKELLCSFVYATATRLRLVATHALPSEFEQALANTAGQFRDLGFGLEPEAWLYLIPPVSMARKLPFPPPSFRAVQEEAMELWQSGNLLSAQEIYAQLLAQTQNYAAVNKVVWVRGLALYWGFLKLVDAHSKVLPADTPEKEWHSEWVHEFLSSKNVDENFTVLLDSLPWHQRAATGGVSANQGNGLNLPEALKGSDSPEYFNVTDLHLAAMGFGDFKEELKKCREGGDPIDEVDICGRTPQHYAAMEGDWRMVRELQQRDLPDYYGYTPMHYACGSGSESAVRYLTNHETSLQCRGIDGSTPVHLAAQNGQSDLLKNLGEFRRKDFAQASQVKDGASCTPLHWAVVGGHLEAAELLGLEEHWKAEGYNGLTAIHLAAAHGRCNVINRILEIASDSMERRDRQKRTPLMWAYRQRELDAVGALLEGGADVNAQDEFGQTALHYAFPFATVEIIEQVCAKGANLVSTDNYGWTPLHFLYRLGNPEGISHLLEKVNVDVADQLGDTPLHVAAQKASVEAIRVLLRAGADPLARNKYGRNSLAHLVYYFWRWEQMEKEDDALEAVKLLVENGGRQILPPRDESELPVEIAMKDMWEDHDIVKYLKKKMAELDDSDVP